MEGSIYGYILPNGYNNKKMVGTFSVTVSDIALVVFLCIKRALGTPEAIPALQ